MADDGLDGGSPSQIAFDGLGEAAFLAGDEYPELVLLGCVMAAIALVDDEPFDGRTDLLFDVGNHFFEGVAVIGIARHGAGMGDELAAGRVIERGGDGDLHAELVRLVRLALGDASDLRRAQGINLLAALALALMAHRMGQRQQLGEGGLLVCRAPDLARDVA